MILVRRYLLVRLYLAWHAAVGLGFGLELLLAPRRLISGPATSTVYHLAPPWQWGLLFVVLSGLCGWAVHRPRTWWRLGILGLGVAQICWALALLAPLITDGRTNLLASTPWIALGVTSGIVALVTAREEHRPTAVAR